MASIDVELELTFDATGMMTGLALVQSELIPPHQVLHDVERNQLLMAPSTFMAFRRRLQIQHDVRRIINRELGDIIGWLQAEGHDPYGPVEGCCGE